MGGLKIAETKIEIPKIPEGMNPFHPIEMPVFTVVPDGKAAGVFKPAEESTLRIIPDLSEKVGVKFLSPSIVERKPHSVVSPKLAIAAVALAGAIGMAVGSHGAEWLVEQIKTGCSFLSLGLLPIFGTAVGPPYRDSVSSDIDLTLVEETKGNILRAIQEGGFLKPSPIFGPKYLELIVDLKSGVILDRKSAPLLPEALEALEELSQKEKDKYVSWWEFFRRVFLGMGVARTQEKIDKLDRKVEKNLLLNPVEGPGWTSFNLTLEDFSQNLINLPDWEVIRLQKMLKREGLSREARGVIMGLIELDRDNNKSVPNESVPGAE